MAAGTAPGKYLGKAWPMMQAGGPPAVCPAAPPSRSRESKCANRAAGQHGAFHEKQRSEPIANSSAQQRAEHGAVPDALTTRYMR